MIKINTEKIRQVASKIALGVEDDRSSPLTELLEFELKDKVLTLKATNKEYFLSVTLVDASDSDEYFHVTIVANSFLQMITKTTTPDIKLSVTEAGLVFEGNGKYIFPITLDGEETVSLPTIEWGEEEVLDLEMDGSILASIQKYNSKELSKDVIVKPIQRLYYVDNHGALTFTDGACVNEFELEKEFKVLFNDRLVQLFKLFDGEKVRMQLSKKKFNDDITQMRVKFTGRNIELTAVLTDTDMVDQYPAIPVRQLAEEEYPGSVSVDKNTILRALERLSILDKRTSDNKVDLKKIGKLHFTAEGLEIKDAKGINFETIPYVNSSYEGDFNSFIDLTDLTKHININNNETVNIKFGTGDAIMLVRKGIKQVIPELEDPTEIINTLG